MTVTFAIGWLKAEPWPPFYQSLTLMFQREVAERIVAPPFETAQLLVM